MLLQFSHFFLPFILLCPVPPPTIILPPQFTSMVHRYKFFGFSISHTILNVPLSILYLPFMLLIPCTFFPFPPLLLPTDKPTCDLYFCESVLVPVVCLVHFCSFLGSVVDSCELSFYCSYFLSSVSQINPFNISYNKGLVMINSFSFTVSGKHFICPSILNDSFAEQSNLGCRSLPFMTLNSFQLLLACKVSFEK